MGEREKSKNLFLLFIIIIAAILAGFFIYPKGIGQNFLPWHLGLDLVGGTHLVYRIDLSGLGNQEHASVASGLRDIMEKRVNSFGVSEPNIILSKSGNEQRLIVELAGIQNPEQAIEQIGRTAFLDFKEISEDSLDINTEEAQENKETEQQEIVKFISSGLNGKYLIKAQTTINNLGQPQVSLTFNSEGAKIFEKITERNIGKPLAIFIDNEIISSPQVKEKIIGGNAVITGLTSEEAKALTNLLNAGALPAPIELISQHVIGATLGAEFLKKAIFAGILGTILIIIFMIAYYKKLGVFSSMALLIYIVLTLMVFKLISITMTLAGISGFILSIGIAIDANILIFERSREEIKKGLTKSSAIQEGFRRAWSSIRDSNITTMISSVILYYSTTSFVRGFALTLFIGVLVSMFSAIFVTRVLLIAFTKNKK